jgi:uncharacterized protein (TIGR03086 family)
MHHHPNPDTGMPDIRALDHRALASATHAVRLVRPEHLDLPTPCAGWTLRDLIGHMVAENRGFTAAAMGDAQLSSWRDDGVGADPAGAFDASTNALVAAFARPGVLESTIRIREFGWYTGEEAIAMHFVDNLVHTWDVARTIGADSTIEDELADAALALAQRWTFERPNVAFDVEVPAPADACAGDRLVALLGREPRWRAA